jgi:nucleotide-binding universal stress UspA family protein
MQVDPREQRKQHAIEEFHRARQKGTWEQILGRLRGREVDLLSYDDVAGQLKVIDSIKRGVEEIPLDAIVGSVGRYEDFTRTFMPRKVHDEARWTGVMVAAPDVTLLPPIDVYQIGEIYFVLDGNHRVSIARQQGHKTISAQVVEVQTRVPLPPGAQPDAMIIQAEYAAFLEHTKLDVLRPGVDMRVTVPGRYDELRAHIEVYRYHIESSEGRELSDEEACGRWYDEAYLPVVHTIHELRLHRHFPGRTETDFFLWVADYQAELKNRIGWDISLKEAAGKLAAHFTDQPTESRWQRWQQRWRQVRQPRPAPTESFAGQPEAKVDPWVEQRRINRYSSTLFADIMVPYSGHEGDWEALSQALLIARREKARLHGLNVLANLGEASVEQAHALYRRFSETCRQAAHEPNVVVEVGNMVEKICERAVLNDLIVLGRAFASSAVDGPLAALLSCSDRPLLVVPGQPAALDALFLIYDGSRKSDVALFIAAYCAEQWKSRLVVAIPHGARHDEESAVDYLHEYLAIHEVQPEMVRPFTLSADTVIQMALEQECQVIVWGERATKNRTPLFEGVLGQWTMPMLIC